MFLTLCVIVSFSLASTEASQNLSATESPCENKCLACQQTVYNLKFHRKSNCANGRCKNTCHKVAQEWNAPGSKFTSFQNDVIGKCEVCFRAGYCSMSECEVQKNFEEAIITQVVEQAPLSGVVDSKPLKNLVSKILSNKKVNFKKIAAKIAKNVKAASKIASKKAFAKLSKTVKAVMVSITPKALSKNLKRANKHIKKASKTNLKINKKIAKLMASYKALIDQTIKSKGKKNYNKKKTAVQKLSKKLTTLINNAIKKFTVYLKKTQALQAKLQKDVAALKKTPKSEKKVKALEASLRKVTKTIEQLAKSLKEAQQAKETLSHMSVAAKNL